MGEKKFLTLEEASEQYAIPVSTLRKKITSGEVIASKPGRGIVIEVKEMDLYMKRKRVNPA